MKEIITRINSSRCRSSVQRTPRKISQKIFLTRQDDFPCNKIRSKVPFAFSLFTFFSFPILSILISSWSFFFRKKKIICTDNNIQLLHLLRFFVARCRVNVEVRGGEGGTQGISWGCCYFLLFYLLS